MFSEGYLQFLAGLKLPPYDPEVRGGNLHMEFSGKWAEAVYWETIALAILNELYFRSLLEKMSDFEKNSVFAEGQLRLHEKIKRLKTAARNPSIGGQAVFDCQKLVFGV